MRRPKTSKGPAASAGLKTVSARVRPETHAAYKALTSLRGESIVDAITRHMESEVAAFKSARHQTTRA